MLVNGIHIIRSCWLAYTWWAEGFASMRLCALSNACAVPLLNNKSNSSPPDSVTSLHLFRYFKKKLSPIFVFH